MVGLAAASTVSANLEMQQRFAYRAPTSYDAGLFAPLEGLGLLSTSGFTTLGHPVFPKYNVRIKKSDFCDGTVRYVCLHYNRNV